MGYGVEKIMTANICGKFAKRSAKKTPLTRDSFGSENRHIREFIMVISVADLSGVIFCMPKSSSSKL